MGMKSRGRDNGQRLVFCCCLLCMLLFSPAGGMAQSEQEQWLSAHNRYRSLHQSRALQWSDALADSARTYADTCPGGHSSSEYGENIAWATYTQIPEKVVGRWYGEEPNYDYGRPRFSSGIGHFTQVVWRATTMIGCACRSDCPGRYNDVCVCQYNPPGNYRNRFRDNVLPPRKE